MLGGPPSASESDWASLKLSAASVDFVVVSGDSTSIVCKFHYYCKILQSKSTYFKESSGISAPLTVSGLAVRDGCAVCDSRFCCDCGVCALYFPRYVCVVRSLFASGKG